jgi:hypothetical protein
MKYQYTETDQLNVSVTLTISELKDLRDAVKVYLKQDNPSAVWSYRSLNTTLEEMLFRSTTQARESLGNMIEALNNEKENDDA